MSAFETFNHTVFLQINASLLTPPWAIVAAKLLANQLIYLIPLLLLGLWCWGDQSKRCMVLKACIILLATLALNQIIGLVGPQPRPFILGIGHTFFEHVPTPSFPSNHAGIFWAVGIVLVANNWHSLLGWIVLALGASVAWARVFLGVHFPLDMLGSLVVVTIAYMAISPIWARIETPVVTTTTQIYRYIFSYPVSLGWIRS